MEEIRQFVKETAEYFADKTPKEVTFRDADNFDYDIYQKYQDWNKLSLNKSFEEEFPEFVVLWEELGSWNAQDDWNSEKAERIISKAKTVLNAKNKD